MELDTLLDKIKSYMDEPDLEMVKKAYQYAERAHQEQFRVSGEPFVEHPLGVAIILADLELDIVSIVASLLHDVVEDTGISSEEIEREFGSEVAHIVDGVTKLTRMQFKTKEDQQAESLRKMFVAMAEDIRVVLIKLADRLHNMRTLNYLKKEKRKEKSRETLEIYAPLAHRLGMSKIKWELEDLSFRYLKPDMYYEVSHKVQANRKQREKDIKEAIEKLKSTLKEHDIEAEIYGRPKHLYSIYNKMKRKEVEFDEIYDLTAVRVLVGSVKECYEVMGVIHEIWKPMPGRFKDYIAMPKSNMYQSLHTTVIAPNGDPLEVQIRTYEMHKTAEYGIAAHWRYKEGKVGDEKFEEKLSWLRRLLEWQKDLQEPQEFMETLKIDLFEDEVFVFTPEGDVVSLPKGGTPVDFAYHIHTEVGHRCVGAKVNGKIVPLEYKLKNSDIVEILTSKKSNGPSRDWLKFVKTSKARSKIKHWFKRQRRDEIIEKGNRILDEHLEKYNIELSEKDKEKELKEITKELGRKDVDDLLEELGYSNISPKQVVSKFKDYEEEKDFEKKHSPQRKTESVDKGVSVKGMEDMLVRMAKCCNPVPGDDIVGYITRGRGVSVHREDCKNLKNLEESEPERIIEVSWEQGRTESYQVDLRIDAVNKSALLNDITHIIKEEKINLLSVMARTSEHNRAVINLSLELSSTEHMYDIMKKIESISGVLNVSRAKPA
ncbi:MULTISPECIES: bifunctional (p)ppGpp synthetase/guanosine-3',5'-bis(diphosphate) 3'-pyrophosphohydrolase [Halanaerobium]|uniref:GTP diphosphokinase n=1 Tax=Halanaerobium saccharolyticum TaxID=43595 RepID=A0A4R6S6E3_9FIRM|nr:MULTISPECIES: bifunctional (p)ppGpp synthetase/guanosine-3',5'-bis(diphosphate) 3'-pyrophosphohydrolase [Halanaerobium]PUU87581.1 MAG: GTP pyrophosphokinase [Halanaerobium sp.]PUU91839.1 MAG: GTP pyrophosphokinase [Halanaerobium sp.]TDP94757.1 GTP pyrophosphokinase [Halanaerobium saccharolyticum]